LAPAELNPRTLQTLPARLAPLGPGDVVLQGELDQRRIFAKGVEELTTPARLMEDESDRARHHNTAQPSVAPACARAAN